MQDSISSNHKSKFGGHALETRAEYRWAEAQNQPGNGLDLSRLSNSSPILAAVPPSKYPVDRHTQEIPAASKEIR